MILVSKKTARWHLKPAKVEGALGADRVCIVHRSTTGAPKLINSDLFLEKRATVPIKTQGVQRSSSGKNVHVLKRGRFLHEYIATRPKYITRVNTTNLLTKSISV